MLLVHSSDENSTINHEMTNEKERPRPRSPTAVTECGTHQKCKFWNIFAAPNTPTVRDEHGRRSPSLPAKFIAHKSHTGSRYRLQHAAAFHSENFLSTESERLIQTGIFVDRWQKDGCVAEGRWQRTFDMLQDIICISFHSQVLISLTLTSRFWCRRIRQARRVVYSTI